MGSLEEEPRNVEDGRTVECSRSLEECKDKKEEVPETEREYPEFLLEKGLSREFIDTLIDSGLSEEHVRLLKALGLSDEEIEKLQKLQRTTKDDRTSVSSMDDRLSPDGLYLKNLLSRPLIEALRDMVSKKPSDPVEYLGHWLLHYKICEERRKRQKELDLELTLERQRIKMQEKVVEDEVSLSIGREEEEEAIVEDWNYLHYEGQ